MPHQAEYFSDSHTATGTKSASILTGRFVEGKVDALNSAEDSMAQYILDYLNAGIYKCFSSCQGCPCYHISTSCCLRSRKRHGSDDNAQIGNPMQEVDNLRHAHSGLRQRNKSPESRSTSSGSFGYELELPAHRTVEPPHIVPDPNPSDRDPAIDTQGPTERGTGRDAGDASFASSATEPSHPPSDAKLIPSGTNRVVDSRDLNYPDPGRGIAEPTAVASEVSVVHSSDISTPQDEGDDYELIDVETGENPRKPDGLDEEDGFIVV